MMGSDRETASVSKNGLYRCLCVSSHRRSGAILLTGYLGGATATHVRIGDPFFGYKSA